MPKRQHKQRWIQSDVSTKENYDRSNETSTISQHIIDRFGQNLDNTTATTKSVYIFEQVTGNTVNPRPPTLILTDDENIFVTAGFQDKSCQWRDNSAGPR